MIKIKKIPIIEAAKLARKHRLFVSGWSLGYEFEYIIKSQKFTGKSIKSYESCLAFDGDIPIGVCLKIYFRKNNKLMVFVRKSYRYNGIGHKLVNLMKDENSYGLTGIYKSNGKIWKLNNIKYKKIY